MSAPGLDHEPEPIRSFDGTVIAARRMGASEGHPVLVVPAVGADLSVWRTVLRPLAEGRPVITWDLRGLHASGPSATPLLDPSAHTEDGIAVMDHFETRHAHVLAWSTGSRIALEYASTYPEMSTSLTLVNGGYGLPLTRLFRHLELVSLLPLAAGVAKHFSKTVGGALRAVTARPEIAGLVRQSGFIGPTADIPALVDLLKGMSECDPRALLETFESVAGDAAPDLLEEIRCPAFIVAGVKDPFVSGEVVDQMGRSIPMAEVQWYERATHYLPLEFPEALARDLQGFWTTVE